MKAKELAEELLKTPEFEVKAVHLHESDAGWGIDMDRFNVNGMADVGYSDGVAVLDLDAPDSN